MANVQPAPSSYQQPQPVQHTPAPTDPFAVVSLIFGILWLFWIGSLLNIY